MTIRRQPLSEGTLLRGNLRQYRLKHEIGEGGYSLVYAAEAENREWVVKELFYEACCIRNSTTGMLEPKQGMAQIHERQRNNCRKEWQLFKDYRDSHIVELVDFVEANNTCYLVMPFVKGESLLDLLMRGPVDAQEMLRILKPIAGALDRLHHKSVIHRDVKPDNIWIRGVDRSPMLLDTGAARSLDVARTKATNLETMMGAPELRGPSESKIYGKVGPATDVFALAGVCACALTGKEPPDPTIRELQLRSHSPDPLVNWPLPVAPCVTKVIRWGLSLKVVDRPQSPSAFIEALEKALAGVEVNTKTSTIHTRKEPIPESGKKQIKTDPASSTAAWIMAATTMLVPIVLLLLVFEGDEFLALLAFAVPHFGSILWCLSWRQARRQSLQPVDVVPVLNVIEVLKSRP